MNVAQVAPSGMGLAHSDRLGRLPRGDGPLKASKQDIRRRPQLGRGAATRTLQYYGAKYVSRSVDQVYPHSKTWSAWLEGGRLSEDQWPCLR